MFGAMTAPAAARPARPLRSIGAFLAAFFGNAILSLATDQLFHVLGVYPPWGEPMYAPELNALALAYRCVYGVLAGWIVARLAPSAPMRHVAVLGIVGFILSTIGAVVAITRGNLGPAWYPIVLAVLSYPAVWLGGVLQQRRQARR